MSDPLPFYVSGGRPPHPVRFRTLKHTRRMPITHQENAARVFYMLLKAIPFGTYEELIGLLSNYDRLDGEDHALAREYVNELQERYPERKDA